MIVLVDGDNEGDGDDAEQLLPHLFVRAVFHALLQNFDQTGELADS